MAKLKTSTAPVNPGIVGTATAVDQWVNGITDNLGTVQDACTKAFEEGQSRGFGTQLAASTAINVNWDVLAAWAPKMANTTGDAVEQVIRDQHARTEPQSSHLMLSQVKADLGLLSNASDPELVERVRAKVGGIMPQRAKDVSQSDGKAKIKAEHAAALKAKDAKRAKSTAELVAAVGDESKITLLAQDALLVEKAYSRWRVRLYLHLIAPLMRAGSVPTSAYERVCGVAAQAHKVLCAKLDKQTRNAKSVEATITTAVTEWIATEYGAKEKDKRTNDEIGKGAVLAIFRNARLAAKVNAIPASVKDVIIAYLTADTASGGAAVADPEVKVAKKTAPVATTRGKKKTTAKVKLPSATPRKARAPRVSPAAPPSTPVTDDSDTDELLNDLGNAA